MMPPVGRTFSAMSWLVGLRARNVIGTERVPVCRTKSFSCSTERAEKRTRYSPDVCAITLSGHSAYGHPGDRNRANSTDGSGSFVWPLGGDLNSRSIPFESRLKNNDSLPPAMYHLEDNCLPSTRWFRTSGGSLVETMAEERAISTASRYAISCRRDMSSELETLSQ